MNTLQNYYEILGVSKNAIAAEIRKAYFALARKYHPDKNFNDPSTEEKFKEISEAYQTLTDVNKRAIYDYSLRGNFTASQQFQRTSPTSSLTDQKIKESVFYALSVFGTWLLLTLLAQFILETYIRAGKNTVLDETTFQTTLDTFQNYIIDNAHNVSASEFCQILSNSLHFCGFFHMNYLNIQSDPPGYVKGAVELFDRNESSHIIVLTSSTGIALTYVALQAFRMGQHNQSLWSQISHDKTKFTHGLFMMLIVGGLMMLGIDALTNCFGIISSMIESCGTAPEAIARGCNAGYNETHQVNNQSYFFSAPKEYTAVVSEPPSTTSLIVAATANILLPPTVALISMFYHKLKNQFDHLGEARSTNQPFNQV